MLLDVTIGSLRTRRQRPAQFAQCRLYAHSIAYTGDQAAVAQGDNFLAILVPKIMATTEYQDHGIIIIRWDETEGGDTTNFCMPEILISPLAKGNAYASSVEMNHSSVLKTMEEIFGLSYLSNAIPASGETKVTGSGYNNVATVNDLSDGVCAGAQNFLQRPAGAKASPMAARWLLAPWPSAPAWPIFSPLLIPAVRRSRSPT